MANRIQVKRGLEINLPILTMGEFALTTDTKKVFVGTNEINVEIANREDIVTIIDNLTKDDIGLSYVDNTPDIEKIVAKAAQLTTSRNFSASGDVSTPQVAFDGTNDVELVVTLANSGVAAGTYTKLTVNQKGIVTSATQIMASDISDLGSAATKNIGINPGNVVEILPNGTIDAGLLPSIAVTDVFEASSEGAMLALDAQQGDICVRTDEYKSYILKRDPASVFANWIILRSPLPEVLSINGEIGVVVISAADLGVTVENLSGLAHPLSHTHDASQIIGGGGIDFPITIPQGGTDADNIVDARKNLNVQEKPKPFFPILKHPNWIPASGGYTQDVSIESIADNENCFVTIATHIDDYEAYSDTGMRPIVQGDGFIRMFCSCLPQGNIRLIIKVEVM